MKDENGGAQPPDNLAAYRAKRSADTTPEPMGSGASAAGHLFVVHKHAARHLHYDLRLEMDGVLKSWAVPKGPSYDTADKRLAVHVEDHPLEYGDFEGVIPAGNYGAGGVIVWDRGEWTPLEDWREGLVKGKLLFELRGHKLRGKWTLVKIKKSARDWLLIKERDEWVRRPGDDFPEESVLSGLTVEEIKTAKSSERSILAALEKTDAPRGRVDARSVKVMLAESADEPFTRDDWVFELKLDGYRLIAGKSGADVVLLTRNGNDYTSVFPDVARAIAALPFERCVLDGEVVVLDDEGKPSFSMLQQRGRLKSSMEIRHATVELPATYYAFDLLSFGDFDLRPLPLLERKRFLMQALPKIGIVRALDHVERQGERFLEQVGALGLEGIIAKKADAPYRAGRTSSWVKIKTERTGDFVIVGFTAPRGSRGHFGALQIADYVNGELIYAGRVGTGFDDNRLRELHEMLGGIVRQDPPCVGPCLEPGSPPLTARDIADTKTTTWVDPVYVCEVRFREWTHEGLLRHPAFVRLRDDKEPRECERGGQWSVVGGGKPAPPTTDHRPPTTIAEKSVGFSNVSKLYWPTERYTKGDLIDYYRAVSKWMLPYLHDRPLVMTRFPDGIDGKSFYQKDAPEFAPEWIRTVPIWSEDTQRDIRYFVCDDVDSLLYIANLGTIPVHIWGSRVGSLETPDWCVIDLDPKDAPFSDVVRCAIALRELCEAIGMPSYVKTTGKTGLHVLLPLGCRCTYAQTRTLGELLARVLLRELGDIATITRHVTRRGDKVYLDYLQNRYGQLIVAPFSVRPLPGATVSMPLLWEEVNQSLDPREFTIRTAVERMERMGSDPVRPVLDQRPDLSAVLDRLAPLLG